MYRFWDLLPRAIRFKWNSTVPTTLNKLQRAGDQQLDHNDQSLLTPAAPKVCHQLEAPKINCPSTFGPKLFTSTHKQSWGQDPNFYRRSFFRSQAFSVIGWGTVITIGLHFNKFQWKLRNNSSNSESSWLQYITYALPLDRLSILDFDQKPFHNGEFKPEEFVQKKQKQDPPDNLDDKFDILCDKITAFNQNIRAIKAAYGGNYEAAVEHWKKSSVLGYSKSNFNLGLCYQMGKGVTKDLTQAMKYYQVAADHDHSEALYNLAMLHPDCSKKAINLLERAAKLGLPAAQTYLGVIYTEKDETNFNKAVEMFEAAAKQQHADAFYYLGVCFETGIGVDQNESKAAELFTKAANEGHSEAQYCLANYYEHGLGGLLRDKKHAHELYQKSAKAGNVNSQNRLQEILQENSNKPDVISKKSSTISVLESEKISQSATLFSNRFLSTMALNLTNNNHNNHLTEEPFSSHLQFMPHCCAKRDILLPVASNPSEVLCT